MIYKKICLLLLAGLVIFGLSAPASAQGTSGLRSKIVDKDGTPLQSARVTIANVALGITQAAVTDPNGEIRIVPLPPGKGYSIEVDFPGMSEDRSIARRIDGQPGGDHAADHAAA